MFFSQMTSAIYTGTESQTVSALSVPPCPLITEEVERLLDASLAPSTLPTAAEMSASILLCLAGLSSVSPNKYLAVLVLDFFSKYFNTAPLFFFCNFNILFYSEVRTNLP